MADKFNLGDEVRELKIGQSFTNPKAVAFHTIRYDFKPASVDINKSATIDVANTNQVTLTVPHLDGAGVPHTVFKGSQKPFQKECVLIIDKITGEVTLEKLTGNIQVKKTRSESAKINHNNDIRNNLSSSSSAPLNSSISNNHSTASNNSNATVASRSQTPPIGQRQSNKTKVTSGSRRPGTDRNVINMVPRHSPLHASPNPGYAQGLHVQTSGGGSGTSPRSPNRNRDRLGDREDLYNQSSLASLPIIGMDDFSTNSSAAVPIKSQPSTTPPMLPNIINNQHNISSHQNSSSSSSTNNASAAPSLGLLNDLGTIGEISDSSSSSSSSDSEEEDESDKEEPPTIKRPAHTAPPPNSSNSWSNSNNSHSNGLSNSNHNHSKSSSVPNAHILNQDLDLSESGSESD